MDAIPPACVYHENKNSDIPNLRESIFRQQEIRYMSTFSVYLVVLMFQNWLFFLYQKLEFSVTCDDNFLKNLQSPHNPEKTYDFR